MFPTTTDSAIMPVAHASSATTRATATALTIVVPVYRNEGSLPALVERLSRLNDELAGQLEVVFVVDGSPDGSYDLLAGVLPDQPFRSRLLAHSRNFGSFAAIRTGLEHVETEYFAMMAADNQEPAELVLDFYEVLRRDEADVVVGTRRRRADAGRSKMASTAFWSMYRRFVQADVPPGGVDMFGGNRRFLDSLLALDESNSSLVGLVFWIGFRRATVEYDRLEREHGTSAWTLRKKLRYLTDSVFSFTDLPIHMLLVVGFTGILVCALASVTVIAGKLLGVIEVPGYAATILTLSFFTAINLLGLGIIGTYVHRTFENTKRRPGAIVMSERDYAGDPRA